MRIIVSPILLFLLSFSALAQTVSRVAPNAGILYFGDSQTSFGFNSNGNAVQYQNYGYLSWVNALAPDVYTPKGGVLGVEGQTTADMLNRLDAIQAFNAKFMVVLAGTNDLTYNLAAATTESNLRQIYTAGLSAGMQVIALTIMPRFGPNVLNAAQEASRQAINAWIKSQTDITVLDVENDLNGSQYFIDGLHNSPLGAYVVGNKVATEVNNRVAHCLPGSLSEADLSVGNANPFFAGTGGSFNNAAGQAATNWELSGYSAGGATVTGAKETDAAGREKQVMAVSGTYTGSYVLATLSNYANTPAGLKSGDVVEGVAEVEIASALTNVKAVYLRVIAYADDWSILADGNSMFPTSSEPLAMPAGKYLLRTPAITIGSGTIGLLSTQVVVEFNSAGTASPVSAVLKASSAGIRHLPLLAGPLASINPAGTVPVCPGKPVQLTAGTGDGYTYQWQLNGASLPSATTPSFSAADPGSYAVQVTAPGCIVLSEPTTVVAGNCVAASIATGSVAAKLCMGQAVGISYTATGTFTAGNVFTAQLSDANGSFASPKAIGSVAATTSGTIAAAIPSNLTQGSGYRIRVVSSTPSVVGTDNGANITLSAIPALTSTLTPPDVCNKAVFSYAPMSSVSGTNFSWSRAAVTGIANAAATGTGNISEALQNTTALPVKVTYLYTLANNGCASPATYKVVVTVNPSPVAKAKNITLPLDAAGKATLAPQQVDNGSIGYCGTLQYSVDKTQFTCANIGNNNVTLKVTDAAGNSGTATAVVTVVDNRGPSITNASVSPSVLTPADHRAVWVVVTYSLADNCGPATASLSVKSSEPQISTTKGDASPDWFVVTNNLLLLRAEHIDNINGRVYTITITAKDSHGNTSTQDVLVKVPGTRAVANIASAGRQPQETATGTEQGLRLSVFPNPSNSQFVLQIQTGNEQPVTVRTYDALGRKVETKNNVSAGSLPIGQNYRPGVYLVEVVQGTQVVTQRLLKQ